MSKKYKNNMLYNNRLTGVASNGMKYLAVLSLMLLPAIASAGVADVFVRIEDNSGLFALVSLWSTIIIMVVTSAMVWIGGRQMRGGVFGTVLTYFSAGMVLVVLGFVSGLPLTEKIPSLYLKLTHDSLYLVGYILMGIAASKLLKAIKGE